MAFCGHVSASGEIVLADEVFSSRTRVGRSSPSLDSPLSLSSPDSLPQNTSSRTYSIKDKGRHSAATDWSPTYDGLKPSESQNNLVPSLCLSSQESSVNYLRHVEGLKVDSQPEAAYENWYSAKQRQRLERQRRLKRERDSKQRSAEERKHLAQACYDQWLKDKARQAASLQLQTHLQTAAAKATLALGRNPLMTASSSSANGSSLTAASRSSRKASQDEIRQVVEDWWLKKQQQQRAQREEKRRHFLSKTLDEERRRRLAQAAWENWMSTVDAKPRPVPLNQGMDSLRGTVSKLYVNPTPWIGPMKPAKK
ncbi:uncharacterized protein LOC108093389 [Drosophila ficusphila]|uniref:uncharacterized protein LOC108093389 n=1 Tax=Drosophila ficusphila TaxID=30025 RepID=UPI0007E7815A|nr:uncharacterized protein LOC108093389 [Drosophila ficusphila]